MPAENYREFENSGDTSTLDPETGNIDTQQAARKLGEDKIRAAQALLDGAVSSKYIREAEENLDRVKTAVERDNVLDQIRNDLEGWREGMARYIDSGNASFLLDKLIYNKLSESEQSAVIRLVLDREDVGEIESLLEVVPSNSISLTDALRLIDNGMALQVAKNEHVVRDVMGHFGDEKTMTTQTGIIALAIIGSGDRAAISYFAEHIGNFYFNSPTAYKVGHYLIHNGYEKEVAQNINLFDSTGVYGADFKLFEEMVDLGFKDLLVNGLAAFSNRINSDRLARDFIERGIITNDEFEMARQKIEGDKTSLQDQTKSSPEPAAAQYIKNADQTIIETKPPRTLSELEDKPFINQLMLDQYKEDTDVFDDNEGIDGTTLELSDGSIFVRFGNIPCLLVWPRNANITAIWAGQEGPRGGGPHMPVRESLENFITENKNQLEPELSPDDAISAELVIGKKEGKPSKYIKLNKVWEDKYPNILADPQRVRELLSAYNIDGMIIPDNLAPEENPNIFVSLKKRQEESLENAETEAILERQTGEKEARDERAINQYSKGLSGLSEQRKKEIRRKLGLDRDGD